MESRARAAAIAEGQQHQDNPLSQMQSRENDSQELTPQAADLEHKPGHFHLPLVILRPSLDKRDIQSKKESIIDQLKNPDEVESTKLALLNFLSVFEEALQCTDEARKTIQQVLDKDPNNLNALQNLAYINRKLGLETKAKRLDATIATLQGNTDVPPNESKACLARSMAEQAFALTYDYFDKDEDDEGTEQTQKYLKAVSLYQSAIDVGTGVVGAEERMTWSFFKAFSHHQLCRQYLEFSQDKGKEWITQHLGNTVESYNEVLHQEPTPLYKAQALVYMTCVLSRTEHSVRYMQLKDILPVVTRLKEKVKEVLEGSVKHAIALAKNNHRVLNTMARALKGKHENVAEAEATVRVSLKAESDPRINWFGYCLKGQLALERYRRNTKDRPRRKGDPGNVELLNDSISDLETSLKGMRSSRIYFLLGEACMKLARSKSDGKTLPTDNGTNDMGHDQLMQALQCFDKALQQDHGPRDPKVHALRAQCLQYLEEEKQAIESWKRAVELDTNTCTYMGNIRSLLTMLLTQCNEFQHSDFQQWQPAVAETATYVKVALSKYPTVKNKFIPELIEQFPEECLASANYLRITGDFDVARTILDYVDRASQRIIWPLQQEIMERRRRIQEDIKENQIALADLKTQEAPGPSRDQEQTGANEEEETGAEVMDEPPPATDEQRAFMPLQLDKPKNKKGFDYDFFVIHSSADAEWVNYTLLAKLEGEHGLKGCIADRDFQLGVKVLDNITTAVKESAKVLVILTPDLVQSRWCKHEMKTALHDRHVEAEEGTESVIAVLLKDCEVPEELRKITYLDARKFFDWDHLLRDIDPQH